MKHKLLWAYIALLYPALCLSSPAHNRHLVEASPERMISYSEKTTGSNIKSGHAAAIINYNHNDVASVLMEYDRYNEFLPFISESKILVPNNGNSKFRITAKILHGAVKLTAIVKSKIYSDLDYSRHVVIALVEGDVKRLNISFKVKRLSKQKSLLVVSFLVDPDLWFVRDSTLSRYNRVNARRTARSIRLRMKWRET